MKDSRTFEEKANAAYGGLPPEWVNELARMADAEALSGVATRVNYSIPAVSNVINNKYAGDLKRFEQMVRGALMSETVECPILGEIGRDRCLVEQKEEFRATSQFRAQLYHACRNGCPHARKAGGEA